MSRSILLFVAAIACIVSVSALTTEQQTCRAGSYLMAKLSGPTIKCPVGQGQAPSTGRIVGTCCTCGSGTFFQQGACQSCTPADKSIVNHGVDTKAAAAGGCKCAAGFSSYNPATKTCSRCPINTAPFNGICTKCAVIKGNIPDYANNWYAKAGSVACSQVTCTGGSATSATGYMPPGGSEIGSCKSCDPTTTRGQRFVNECLCKPGFGNFNPQTGACAPCGNGEVSYAGYVPGTPQTSGPTPQICIACSTLAATSSATGPVPNSRFVPNAAKDTCVAV